MPAARQNAEGHRRTRALMAPPGGGKLSISCAQRRHHRSARHARRAEVPSRENALPNRLTRAALPAPLLALPATLGAQARTPAARPATPTSAAAANARTWLNELQRISARLQAAHNRAMQDDALRTAQET